MNKVYTKQITDQELKKKLIDAGYFGEKPEITGTLPEGKRDYYRRHGLSDKIDEEILVGDVLDWLRESYGVNVIVEPYRDKSGIMYCGKIVDLNTGSGKLWEGGDDFESILMSTISGALEEWGLIG